METQISKLIEEISDQMFRLERAKSNGVMVRDEIERMKNVLFNNVGNIKEALSIAAEADEKIKILELQLDDAESDLKEAEAKLKAMKEPAPAAKKEKKPDAEQ